MSSTQSSTNKSSTTASAGTGLTNADKQAAAKKAGGQGAQGAIGRTKPWVDLVANPELIAKGPPPREKTVLFAMNTLLKERGREGASNEEIKKEFAKINLESHDPVQLMRWANKNRGYGYHQRKDNKYVLRTKVEE